MKDAVKNMDMTMIGAALEDLKQRYPDAVFFIYSCLDEIYNGNEDIAVVLGKLGRFEELPRSCAQLCKELESWKV